jgi:hypothetical protein
MTIYEEVIRQSAAAPGGGCFTGDTLVSMADGTRKPIKDIRVGDC